MNFIATKSKKLYNFYFDMVNFEPASRHICFIGRNIDSRTTMLEDHASQ